jgi:predicted TIM-barrel fold metal-dependent hydrolase
MTQSLDEDVLAERVAKIPPIVDLDAHVVEPATLWYDRLPARLREVGPRVEYAPAGEVTLVDGKYVETPGTEGPTAAWWVYDGNQAQIKRYIASVGVPAEQVTNEGITYDDMRPGCYITAERVKDMDINGVQAQMCFPNFIRFCGQIFLWAKDKSLAKLCVEAYNDWMVDEWAGGSGGRLIPLCIVPLWDVDLAVTEVRRNAARGVRSVAFTELPAYLDLPSLHSGYWDPFFAACSETGTVLSMHIGSGTKTPQTSADAPGAVVGTIIFGNSVASMTDFMFSGVLHRYPNLKLLYAEAQIGWIPYLLERIDDVWETTGAGPGGRRTARSRRRRTTTGRSTAASSRTRSGSSCWTRSASTTWPSRPTTRTRTAPGRARARRRPSSSATWSRTWSTRSPAATRSSCSAWTCPKPERPLGGRRSGHAARNAGPGLDNV